MCGPARSPAGPRDTSAVTIVLAIADEVDEALCADPGLAGRPDLVLACGDLPFDYLEYVMVALDVPLVFVPGNHDPDVSGWRTSRAGLSLRAGMPTRQPWPPGAVNADGTVVEAAGLRIAGLGGCLRYADGPNQYTERQQRRRARALARRARWRQSRPVDVLLTHAPPLGVNDRDDPPHRGFACLHDLAAALRTPLLLHGHVHPFGESVPDGRTGDAVVRNVVGRHRFAVSGVTAGCR